MLAGDGEDSGEGGGSTAEQRGGEGGWEGDGDHEALGKAEPEDGGEGGLGGDAAIAEDEARAATTVCGAVAGNGNAATEICGSKIST